MHKTKGKRFTYKFNFSKLIFVNCPLWDLRCPPLLAGAVPPSLPSQVESQNSEDSPGDSCSSPLLSRPPSVPPQLLQNALLSRRALAEPLGWHRGPRHPLLPEAPEKSRKCGALMVHVHQARDTRGVPVLGIMVVTGGGQGQ